MTPSLAAGGPGATAGGHPAPLGVLGAIEAEVVLVREHLVDTADESVGRLRLTRGYLDVDTARRQPVVLARCGVGKVNAAVAACALAQVGVRQAVFTGVAGALSRDLGIGDIVVATDLVQHDVDVTALGHRPGELLGEPLAWDADPELSRRVADAARAAALQSPGDSCAGGASVPGRVVRGRIASGDQFIASAPGAARLREQFGALCAEMEGAAFAQACSGLGVRFAVVRTMSDTADGSAPVDFPAFLETASRTGHALVECLVRGMLG